MDGQSSPLALNCDNERVTVVELCRCHTPDCKGELPDMSGMFISYPPRCVICGTLYEITQYTAEDLNWGENVTPGYGPLPFSFPM